MSSYLHHSVNSQERAVKNSQQNYFIFHNDNLQVIFNYWEDNDQNKCQKCEKKITMKNYLIFAWVFFCLLRPLQTFQKHNRFTEFLKKKKKRREIMKKCFCWYCTLKKQPYCITINTKRHNMRALLLWIKRWNSYAMQKIANKWHRNLEYPLLST